jgi:hypothetical protein
LLDLVEVFFFTFYFLVILEVFLPPEGAREACCRSGAGVGAGAGGGAGGGACARHGSFMQQAWQFPQQQLLQQQQQRIPEE